MRNLDLKRLKKVRAVFISISQFKQLKNFSDKKGD